MSKHTEFCGDDACRGECVTNEERERLVDAVVDAALDYVRADIDEMDDMPHWKRLQDASKALQKFRAEHR